MKVRYLHIFCSNFGLLQLQREYLPLQLLNAQLCLPVALLLCIILMKFAWFSFSYSGFYFVVFPHVSLFYFHFFSLSLFLPFICVLCRSSHTHSQWLCCWCKNIDNVAWSMMNSPPGSYVLFSYCCYSVQEHTFNLKLIRKKKMSYIVLTRCYIFLYLKIDLKVVSYQPACNINLLSFQWVFTGKQKHINKGSPLSFIFFCK